MNAFTALVLARPANGLARRRQVLRQACDDVALASPPIESPFALEPLESRRLLSGGFGDSGYTHADVPGFDPGSVAQPTVITSGQGGKIYVGSIVWGSADLTVTRFNADGSVDTGFGNDGSGTVEVPTDEQTVVDHFIEQPNGNVLITAESPDGLSVVMLNADGSVDTNFGGGLQTFDVFKWFPSYAVTYNDNVSLTSSGDIKLTAMNNGNLVTLMLGADGQPDSSFAPDGVVTSPVDPSGDPVEQDVLVAAQSTADGGLVGYADIWAADLSHHLVRLTIDAQGNVTSQTPVNTGLNASAEVTGNGYGLDYLVAFSPDGSAYISAQGPENRIAKLTPGGQLDPSFGSGGLVTLPDAYAAVYSATPDGGVLVEAGRYDPMWFGAEDAAVKLTAGGSIDPNFNNGQPAGLGALPAVQLADGSTLLAYAGGGYDDAGNPVAPSIVLEKIDAGVPESLQTGDPAAMAAIKHGQDAANTPADGFFSDDLYGVVWDPNGEPGVLDAGA